MSFTRVRVATIGGVLVLPLMVSAGTAAVPAETGNVGRDQPHAVEYVVAELGPASGGTASASNSINNIGWAAGTSTLPEGVVHATLWRDGMPTDLGTLGGPNSAVLWPNKNTNGLVVGVAETAEMDPNGEAWSCSAFFPSETGRVCLGFVWEDGEMRDLSTFGGTHGFATGVNNDGLVVGWAETPRKDPSCTDRDQVLEFVGAVWDTRRGDRIRMLKPLPGDDSASTGNAINDRGQVVGISGSCDQAVGRLSARTAVLWHAARGRPIDLGNFGSEAWNTPMAINNHTVVVGFANAADAEGADFDAVPFRWTRLDGMQQLDTLEGEPNGQALGINDHGLVGGLSRAERDTAVIWKGDEVIDLNDLTPGYDGHLDYAGDINDDGVITGGATSADGQNVAFIATPVDD
ncbi:MAG: DUF3466 family protein [Propionibacteriales bacterium]|nr:DUF3466 family protein [Propionibacteriales bacterium]